MLLPYRIIIWLLLGFEAMNVVDVLHVPVLEPTHNWNMVFVYHLCGYVLFEILWFLGKRFKLHFSPHIFLWLIAAIVHNIPGTMYGLFTNFSWYDQLAHFALMGFFLALVMFEITREVLGTQGLRNHFLILIITFCAAATIGVANEILEYILNMLDTASHVYLESAGDTANDLVMNATGAALYLLFRNITSGASSSSKIS